jgi:beta-lactam-binding protein with PASTA domain
MSAYDTVILGDNPAGYWPLSETSGTVADDLSTGANNGAYVGGPTLGQTPIAMELGDSVIFSGTSSMQTPSSAAYGFTTGSYSVEAWIYPTALSGFQEFISTQGYVRFLLSNTNLQSYIGGTLAVSSPTNLSTDTPYYVVLTVDNVALTTNVYINGALDTSRNNSPNIINPDQTPVGLIVGSLDGSGTHQYSGNISNVALYPVALTPTQVLAHYTAGTTPPATITVPNVVGLSLADAETAITTATLVVGTVTTASSGTVPAGDIISQSPVAGTLVATGSAVDLLESSGPTPILVPNVINLSQAIATEEIIAAGFVVGTVLPVSDVLIIAGNVSAQTPAGGSYAEPDSAINLLISTGRAGVVVPNLSGLTEAEAIAAVVAVGLVVNVISTSPSAFVEEGLVLAQNPTAGLMVASGSFVGFIVSSGPPVVGEIFNFEQTVISQYANSPTLLQLIQNMNGYLDQTANFAAFYNFVWNVDTAQGFGLDIWGKIVNVSRLLQIPNSAEYFGFQDGSSSGPGPGWDVQPFNALGTFFTGNDATQSYLLDDDAYRTLILTKAFSNIVNTTAPALNQLLQNLFPGRGVCYVQNDGGMAITYVFEFELTPVELAILQQSGAVPSPVGVSVSISVI